MPHRLAPPSTPFPFPPLTTLIAPLLPFCHAVGILFHALSSAHRPKLIEFLYHKFSRISGQAFCRFNCCHHQRSSVKFLRSTQPSSPFSQCKGLLRLLAKLFRVCRAFQFVSYLTHFCHLRLGCGLLLPKEGGRRGKESVGEGRGQQVSALWLATAAIKAIAA